MKKYIELKNLEVYQISRQISYQSWEIYQEMNWKHQKLIGDQFIRSADSVGANIAEGYARFHDLDRARFYIIAKASLSEYGYHWLDLMYERQLLGQDHFNQIRTLQKKLEIKLNNYISQTRKNAK